MRLGGPVDEKYADPDGWLAAVTRLGYRAAYCPVKDEAGDDEVNAYAEAAAAADIVIAVVGAWSNPVSRDEDTRREAVALCKRRLQLADRIGARCCVNISGSRGEAWARHHPDNLTDETFDMIVETVRDIIDSVKPTRTFYALEAMPWMYPDSAESYLQLIKAMDRDRFAVHLDPVNIVTSPRVYYDTGALIRECFAKLGRYVKSCHAKDTAMSHKLTVHIDEVRPGLGGLDYRTYLKELSKLDADTPLMLEHLRTAEDYAEAAKYVRSVAEELGLAL